MHSTALNHVYRLVWSEFANAWVAVAEHTSGRGRKSRTARALIVSALLGAASSVHGQVNVLPTAGRIVAGSGAIAQTGPTMTVTQASDRLVIDWNSFDIGARSGVRFAQPGSGSIALNRVTGGSASSILGSLTANGQVWLVNPSGVVFGSGARVDVGGLVASSLALSDSDFLAGRNRFTDGTGAGAVVNRGYITATGGVVALLAPQVRNEGTITTTGGSTVLAAGDRVSLDFGSDGLVSVAIDRSVVDAAVDNSGRIGADGGMVVLSARSANKALDSVVNNTGVIEAQGLVARNGRILLDGDAGQGNTHVAGTLDVSSATGQGGSITVTGHDITLDHGATLDASGATGGGSIRVGGGFQGKDTSVANATTVEVDGSVTARADATGDGDGGKVVFWSDDATRFAGKLSVRGGALGGDGGSLEVSGKQNLAYSGRSDARAPLGRTGDLLLDPATLTVSGGGTGTGVLTGTTVYEKDLEAQNANVLLQATGVVTVGNLLLNGGDGTITMANNVSLRVEGGTGGSGNINFTNPANTIEVFGTGSLMFVAGATGTGNIVNAPNLIAHGAGTNPGTLPTHVVTSVGSGTPGAGSVTLFGADGVTVGGTVTTNGGYVRVWADSDNAGGGGYSMTAPVVTNGGNFYVSAGTGAIDLNANMTLGTGRIQFQADGTYTSGTRTLGGILSASGAFNVNTPFVMNAGAGIYTDGVITFSNTVNLNTGAGALTLRASAIDFTSATLINLSTASLILQPANIATSMVLGDASGFASATTLAKLPGVKNLTIGRTDGTGTASVASNFSFSATGMLEVVNRTVAVTGGTLTNTTGNVTLTGDNVNISQQVTSNAGAGSVTIRQLTAANPINLGSGLPNSVIGQVNAATLVIGRSDGGDVTFDSNIATTASTVHLLSGGQVIGTAGGVSAANLAINAGGGATLGAPAFNFTKLALAVGGPTTIAQTQGGFTIAAVDGVTGLAINAGTNANVTLSSAGAISASGTLALNANTSLLTLNATAVDLASSTVTGATNASFALRPLNASDNLAINATSGFASTATLTKLTNSKNVTVGRSDGSGLSTVSAFVSLAASGSLELVNGQVTLANSVYNNVGGLKLTALAGNLTLNTANLTAGSQMTLSASGGSVGGTGTIIAPALLINAPAAAVALNGSSNNVGAIAGHVGSLSFVDTASLLVGTVGGVNGVTSAGNLTLRTTGAAADLTLNQAVSGSGAGNAVVLAAGRNFVNTSGASAISAAGGGRWLVYSGSPLSDTRGGLSYAFKQYNAAYGATVLGSGSGFVYRAAPTATIGLTGTTSKVYDADTAATLTSGNYTTSGAIDGDTVTFASTGASYATKGVGTGKSVSANGLSLTGANNGAATVYGYQLAGTTATGNIGQVTPATLTVGIASVADKVYNATTVASVNSVALTGVIGSDAIGTSATGAFANKNVGNGKAVTVSGITLTGADAGNYVLSSPNASGTASITPATLTVGAASVADKVYDATTIASVSGVALTGVIGSDAIGTTALGAFADRNVANGKAVTVSGVALTGADAGNYVLSSTNASGTASITPATLTVGASTIADKVYDATTSATVSGVALTGVFGSDAIGTTATGAFADKNVANGKAVTVSGVALTGADAGNYVLSSANSSGTASITPATLTVGSSTIADKVYDATTVASVSAVALTGVLGSDVIGATATGSFADKNVGNGKVVALSTTLTGTDAGNYVVSSTGANGTASITPATLTVGGATVVDKVYDATTVASVSGVALTGVIGSDAIGTTATGTFANKNVGNGKAVAVNGVALTGTDAANYVLDTTSSVGSASITPATLTVGASTIADKVYDATTVASVSGVALTGVIGSDAIGSTATGAFASKNVGNGKAVTVNGVTLTGADAGNYVLDTTGSIGTASITPATLAVGSATVADKVYDATTSATVSGVALTGVIGSDAIGTTATGTFANKNVGNGKAVTVGDVALTGADAGNYALSSTNSSGTASITAATLTVGAATIADKVYDATTAASVSGVALTGVLGSDVVGAAGTGAFGDRNVGTGKAVTVNGVALNGSDAGNYVLSSASSSGSGNITPATLTVGASTIADKVYDATTGAVVSGVALTGVLGSDVVGAAGTGAFGDKNVGTGKAVTVNGVALNGSDAGNYVLSSTSSNGTATITRALLNVGAATIADKVYDTTTAASVGGIALTGVFGGDAIGTIATGAFSDKNVGNAKAVTVSGIALTGADGGNYALSSTSSSGLGNITAATLTLGAATIADKVYDATTAASVSGVALTGVLGSDAVGAAGIGAFGDKNVGNGKAVAVSAALGGADAGNYVLASTGAVGTASITPATLTVGVATVADKVYDATPLAAVSAVALTGVIGGDVIGATATGAFANKNVGNGKAVTVNGVALTGTDAGNYVLDTTGSTGTASITPATLTVGGATVADKVYDATPVASVSGVALTGVIGGDVIGTTATGAFVNKNVGTAKVVNVDGVSLTGSDSGNYVLGTTGSTGRASITPATLTVGGATVADKNYDGNTTATVGAVDLSGVLGSDRVAASASGRFADPEVGLGKPVAVSGIALGGIDAGNYTLATTDTTGRATIEPATAGLVPSPAPVPGTIAAGTLAALLSPQVRSNAGADGLDAMTAGGALTTGTAPSAGDTAVTGGLFTSLSIAGSDGATASDGGSTAARSAANTAGRADPAGNGPFATGGDGTLAGPMVDVPDTLLTAGGRFSIAVGGPRLTKAVAASLPVYSVSPGVPLHGEGQFIVTDDGGSLSLTADGAEHVAAPSLTQRVSGSARGMVPLSSTASVEMRVDLLADLTLVATIPDLTASQSTETLATFGLVVAKSGLSIGVDEIRAIVLRFGPQAGQPDIDGQDREPTSGKRRS